MHADNPGAYDIRCIGLEVYPLGHGFNDIKSDLTEIFAATQSPSIKTNGDIVEISAERHFDLQGVPKQSRVFEFLIDTSKDNALIKYTIVRKLPGKSPMVCGESRTEYKLMDGYWFPVRCDEWMFNADEQKQSAKYELVSGEFDRPEHPKRLGVEMLRIPAGAWVSMPSSPDPLVWNGSSAVPRETWLEIKGATDSRELSALRAKNQREDNYRYPAWWYDDTGKMGIADLETNPDTWEAYVRRWCMKNGVDDKQRTEAKAVLESSRKEARAILDKRAPDLDKIEAKLKDKTLDPRKADEARTEANRLLAPIGEIFNRLKARLESLLLQKQISAKQPTTAPAAKP